MQLLLTDTRFQIVSGTRVAVRAFIPAHAQVDAIEIPSTIMEFCCSDPTVLQQINQTSKELSHQARTASDKVLRFYHKLCSSVPPYSFYVVPARDGHV